MLQVELTCCERTVDSLQQTVDSMQGKSTPVLPQLKELAGQFEAFSSTEIKGKLLAFTEFVHQSSKTGFSARDSAEGSASNEVLACKAAVCGSCGPVQGPWKQDSVGKAWCSQPRHGINGGRNHQRAY